MNASPKTSNASESPVATYREVVITSTRSAAAAYNGGRHRDAVRHLEVAEAAMRELRALIAPKERSNG